MPNIDRYSYTFHLLFRSNWNDQQNILQLMCIERLRAIRPTENLLLSVTFATRSHWKFIFHIRPVYLFLYFFPLISRSTYSFCNLCVSWFFDIGNFLYYDAKNKAIITMAILYSFFFLLSSILQAIAQTAKV